jgi:hypothetical protein
MARTGIELPAVDFSTLSYSGITPGSYFIGIDSNNSGALTKINGSGEVSIIEGASASSLQRVDVVSFGVQQGTSSEETALDGHALRNGNNIKPLLWEVVTSTGNKLMTDTGFPDIVDTSTFILALDAYSIGQNLNITVRGYYYIDDSKEKFRLVGKNAAYWSLVGLNNYGRMGNNLRVIDPATIGQAIITAVREYSIPIGSSGEGLIFTSQDGSRFGRPVVSPPSFDGKKYDPYYGINGGGTPVPLISELIAGTSWPDDTFYVECSRSGVDLIYSIHKEIQPRPTSLVEFSRITVITNHYPGPSGLDAWLVRAVGQDTVLLSNNSDIQVSDKVFVIPDNTFNIPYLSEITIHSQIDDAGFGEDLVTSELKTSKDRFGSIRAEEINCDKVNIRNKGNNIKYRVAYGKDGIYTVSTDYINLVGTGRYVAPLVNRER